MKRPIDPVEGDKYVDEENQKYFFNGAVWIKYKSLTGFDYMTRPVLEIMSHPDYDDHAFRIANRMGRMTTEQLKQVNLIGGMN